VRGPLWPRFFLHGGLDITFDFQQVKSVAGKAESQKPFEERRFASVREYAEWAEISREAAYYRVGKGKVPGAFRDEAGVWVIEVKTLLAARAELKAKGAALTQAAQGVGR